MKNKLFLLLTIIAVELLSAQTRYDETEPITNLPLGVYWQNGPGDNNTFNWMHRFSTKLTVNGGISRNFELSSIGKNNDGFLIRQFSQDTNSWTTWKKLILDDDNVGFSGNVGIGTTTPSEKLEVNGGNVKFINDNSSTNLIIESSGTENYRGGFIYLKSSSIDPENKHVSTMLGSHRSTDGIAKFQIQRRGHNEAYNGTLASYSDTTGWIFSVAKSIDSQYPESVLRIFNTGNIGIGTTDTKDYKLAVAGDKGIIAEKITVKVEEQWEIPDYVFKKDYDLPTLKEVEKHIIKKGHLKDIPSAKEIVKKGGFELGNMNKKLLQKIEELTLYTIQQEKQLQLLMKRLEALEKKNK